MKIKRIYNNNVVVSNDMSGKEIIIIGRGIAFQKKVGEEIDQVKVEKIFSANDESIENNLKRLLESIPANNLELCHDIVTMINKNSELKVSDNIYVTLADHLSVSLKREQGGIIISNPLLPEIKQFYKEEFQLALKGAEIIWDQMDIRVSENEVGFIALHIINATMNQNIQDMMNITKLVNEIIAIIEDNYKMKLDDKSIYYARFIRHLQFFAQRVFNDEINNQIDYLSMKVNEEFINEKQCVDDICIFIERKYHKKVSETERGYLVYHIANMTHEHN